MTNAAVVWLEGEAVPAVVYKRHRCIGYCCSSCKLAVGFHCRHFYKALAFDTLCGSERICAEDRGGKAHHIPDYDVQQHLWCQSQKPFVLFPSDDREAYAAVLYVMKMRVGGNPPDILTPEPLEDGEVCEECHSGLYLRRNEARSRIWGQAGCHFAFMESWCCRCCNHVNKLYDGRADAIFVLDSKHAFTYELMFAHFDKILKDGETAASFFANTVTQAVRLETVKRDEYSVKQHTWKRIFTDAVIQCIMLRLKGCKDSQTLCPICGTSPKTLIADGVVQGTRLKGAKYADAVMCDKSILDEEETTNGITGMTRKDYAMLGGIKGVTSLRTLLQKYRSSDVSKGGLNGKEFQALLNGPWPVWLTNILKHMLTKTKGVTGNSEEIVDGGVGISIEIESRTKYRFPEGEGRKLVYSDLLQCVTSVGPAACLISLALGSSVSVEEVEESSSEIDLISISMRTQTINGNIWRALLASTNLQQNVKLLEHACMKVPLLRDLLAESDESELPVKRIPDWLRGYIQRMAEIADAYAEAAGSVEGEDTVTQLERQVDISVSNDWKAGAFYPAFLRKARPQSKFTKDATNQERRAKRKRGETGACNKEAPSNKKFTNGFLFVLCPHRVPYGFQHMSEAESPRILFDFIANRLSLDGSKIMILYDNVCHVHTYVLGRIPALASMLIPQHDRLHVKNHVCDKNFDPESHSSLSGVFSLLSAVVEEKDLLTTEDRTAHYAKLLSLLKNTQACEQFNSVFRRITRQVMYYTSRNVMFYVRNFQDMYLRAMLLGEGPLGLPESSIFTQLPTVTRQEAAALDAFIERRSLDDATLRAGFKSTMPGSETSSKTIVHADSHKVKKGKVVSVVPTPGFTESIRQDIPAPIPIERPIGKNWCYRHSCLQLLASIPCNSQDLIDVMSDIAAVPSNSHSAAKILHSVMWDRSPTILNTITSRIRDMIANQESMSIYNNNLQQDGAEFIGHFLQLLVEEHYETITDLFEGRSRTQYRCMRLRRCADWSISTRDSFRILTLPMIDERATRSPDSRSSLQILLSKLTQWKDVVDLECDRCSKKTNVSSQLKISTLPQLLLIQLLRFTPTTKIMARIDYTAQLEISSLPMVKHNAKETRVYNLIGVVNHIGMSRNSGHYVAVSKRGSTWYRCDDEHIQRVRSISRFTDAAYDTETVYMLLYTLNDRAKVATK